MRALVQRVTRASVTVDGRVVGEIGAGLLVLVGVTHGDDHATALALARKVHGLRLFRGPADDGRAGAELSLADLPTHAALVVSQFTLYGDARKGRRPTWQAAAPGPVAEPLVEAFASALRDLGTRVEAGMFGADMAVELVNDGPLTLLVEL